MKFMVYDPNFDTNAGAPQPTPEMMAEVGAFMDEAIKAGVLITTGALLPTGTRLRLSDGKFAVTDVPSIKLKELMAGFAVLQVSSLEEAVEWSKRFRKIVGEGESEIVQVFGAADMAQL